ncbi:MAG: TlyA family RNA methyltransferase [Proteobacteria bacterium]|nr:TlyA family RNA methyltransferase [Pseudomonadota bacterium]
MASGKRRLDAALVERGFFPNSDQAARAVMAGQVYIKGQPVSKPGTPVAPDADISLAAKEKYVGRGGLKLEAALDHFHIDPSGLVCVDIGASTGGFTDCLLQRGASLVHAVDVGHSQLHWRLRGDSRVFCREGFNARFLEPNDLSPPPVFAVGDVSFISLTAILPAVFNVLPEGSDAVFLIKPQFEAPKGSLPPGGVIRDDSVRLACVEKMKNFVEQSGQQWLGCIPSPITGHDGNVEYLAHIKRVGEPI